jgi:cold shock CspA family protein
MTHSGKVISYNETRGFGFIREISNNASERFPEFYFHITDVTQQLALNAGDLVYFRVVISSRTGKLVATDVRLTTANSYTPSGALTLDEIKKIDEDGRQ